jgi:hypothetical protein
VTGGTPTPTITFNGQVIINGQVTIKQ